MLRCPRCPAVHRRRAHSRTAATREVERACIFWVASFGQRAPAIAIALHLSAQSVRRWLKRCNADGLARLTDTCRSGRPATYTPEQAEAVLVTAMTDLQQLHLPSSGWTLDRLEVYLNASQGIPIERWRITVAVPRSLTQVGSSKGQKSS
jgi:transposase